jgi:hypothetical protein
MIIIYGCLIVNEKIGYLFLVIIVFTNLLVIALIFKTIDKSSWRHSVSITD